MLHNHLFWLAVGLFFCSAININAFLEYRKTFPLWSYVLGVVGLLGLVGWSVRIFALAAEFNWWWLFGVGAASLLFTGIFSFFTRRNVNLIAGSINLVLIPLIWWYGSKFCYHVPFTWFYDSIDAVKGFFS